MSTLRRTVLGVELLALLDQDDEVLEQRAHALGIRPLDGDLVAADVHRDLGELRLDGTEHLIPVAEEGRHEVVGGNGDPDLGDGQEVALSP